MQDVLLHGSTPTVTPSDEIVDDWSISIDEVVALCVGQCNTPAVPALPPEEGEYWQHRLKLCGPSSQKIWHSMTTLLGRNRNISCAAGHTADSFAAFFACKIDGVRADTAGLPPPPVLMPATSLIASFCPCTQAEIWKIIMSAPIKSCLLDPVPTFLVHELIDVLLPLITLMVNVSLARGRLPASQICAIITPLLKKLGLDSTDME